MLSSRVVHGIIIATAGGLALVHTVPNIYPSLVVNYYGFNNVEIPPKIEDSYQVVAKNMDLYKRHKVKLFINNGSSSVSAGTTLLPGGAVIGVSRLFLYSNVTELSESGLTFEGKKINMTSKAGQKLSQSLLFDDDELKFILAHEISHLKHLDFLTNCFLPPCWFYFTYRAILVLSNYSPANLVAKLLLQFSLSILSYWFFNHKMSDFHHKQEFSADKNAALVDVSYVKGGMSLMLKRMQLNQALRALHGDVGKEFFSYEGNDLRDFEHPKLTERLRKLEEIYVQKYVGVQTNILHENLKS